MCSTRSTRDQIVDTASSLFEQQGYAATGLNQIVRESGAPKGSLYHYFPGGKDEIAVEALTLGAERVTAEIRGALAGVDDPGEAIKAYVLSLADRLRDSSFRRGAPLAAVALETAALNPRLNAVCRDAYRAWQDAFREKLSRSNYAGGRAERLAAFVVASIEGAILLSRVRRSTEPLREVADDLELLLGRRSLVESRRMNGLAVSAVPPTPVAARRPSRPPRRTSRRPPPSRAAEAPAADVPLGHLPAPAAGAPPAAPVTRPDNGREATVAEDDSDLADLPPLPQETGNRVIARRSLRILVLGASGGTGSHLIEQALAAGHSVTALARDPSSIWVKHERLAVVKGDVRDAERMDEVVAAGIDAVVSALGHTQGATRDMLTVGAQNIFAAMERLGVRRLVVLMGADLPDPHDEITLARSMGLRLRRLSNGRLVEDWEGAAEVIRGSALDWTIVRAARLTDGPRTSFYLTGYLKLGANHSIARGDVAEFMLRQGTDNEFLHAAPLISY